jgi:hypothetical protein
MDDWHTFGDGFKYPDWNTLIYIKQKEGKDIQRVFYGSEESKNPDPSIPNITKCGKIGLKLQWKYEL